MQFAAELNLVILKLVKVGKFEEKNAIKYFSTLKYKGIMEIKEETQNIQK